MTWRQLEAGRVLAPTRKVYRTLEAAGSWESTCTNKEGVQNFGGSWKLGEYLHQQGRCTQLWRQLEAGRVLAPTRKMYRTEEKRLKTIQQKFTNDEYSLDGRSIAAVTNKK